MAFSFSHLLFCPHTEPLACPDMLSHWLPPNSEGQGQNNLYLFNKTLKTIMPCPLPLPFSSALKGLVNVSKLHIRQRSQTINLKDTHRVPAGFFFLTPLASVVLTPSFLQKWSVCVYRGGACNGGDGKIAYKVYPPVIKQSTFQKQPFDTWNTLKQNELTAFICQKYSDSVYPHQAHCLFTILCKLFV